MKMLAMATLINKGYDPKRLGTWYLAEAIAHTVQTGRPMMMTKDVYPAIAKDYQTTPAAVERAMRGVIKDTEPGVTAGEAVMCYAVERMLDEG